MIDTISAIIAGMVLLTFFAALLTMCFEDTETFRAIDEKIARFIKGEEDE